MADVKVPLSVHTLSTFSSVITTPIFILRFNKTKKSYRINNEINFSTFCQVVKICQYMTYYDTPSTIYTLIYNVVCTFTRIRKQILN